MSREGTESSFGHLATSTELPLVILQVLTASEAILLKIPHNGKTWLFSGQSRSDCSGHDTLKRVGLRLNWHVPMVPVVLNIFTWRSVHTSVPPHTLFHLFSTSRHPGTLPYVYAYRGYLSFVSIFVVYVCVTSTTVRGEGEEFKWQGRLGYFREVKINWIIPAGARARTRTYVCTYACFEGRQAGTAS